MGWTKITPPKPHVCDKPYYVGNDVTTNDIVQCDCGQKWLCTGIDSGMQWDPYPVPVLKWVRIKSD